MPILILCLVMGLVWGCLFTAGMTLAGFPMETLDALWSGLLFGALLFPVFALMGRLQQKRIQAAAQKLPSPCTHRFSAMLHEGKQPQAMALFLCGEALCLVAIEKKEMPMTVVPGDALIRAVLSAPNQLELHLTGERCLRLRTKHAEAILSALKEKGWLPFQH